MKLLRHNALLLAALCTTLSMTSAFLPPGMSASPASSRARGALQAQKDAQQSLAETLQSEDSAQGSDRQGQQAEPGVAEGAQDASESSHSKVVEDFDNEEVMAEHEIFGKTKDPNNAAVHDSEDTTH